MRHAIEPRTDPHKEAERKFSLELAQMLDKELASNKFEKLIVVAPPVMLGDLRKALSKRVGSAVVAEIAKDLTKIPEKEIVEHLEAELAS